MVLFFFTFFLYACQSSCPKHETIADPTKPTQSCSLTFSNNQQLDDIPLAQTVAQQNKGLSGKNPQSNKMLFFFEPPVEMAFWMKDTYLPLSIGFFDQNGYLYEIKNMQPNTQTIHYTEQKIIAALELTQGEFEKINLPIGVRLIDITCRPQT